MHKKSYSMYDKSAIIWEWQSNANPWSDEPAEWKPYDQSSSKMLENAYQNNIQEVELGKYVVLFDGKDIIQQKKDDPSKQRRVRRKEEPFNSVTALKPNRVEVQWEWQSNANPWSSAEPPQWTPYKDHENKLLEKAFKDGEKKIDLGEFIVILDEKSMYQQRKNDASRTRRVRRGKILDQEPIEEEEMRPNRFFGAEKPKTYNKTFGSLQDYLTFFKYRNPEISKFAKLYKEIEKSFDANKLNQELVPLVIKSFPGGTLNQFHSENFTSIEEFLHKILWAYTVQSSLFVNLNKYLREEDWVKLDYYLPYAFCLCKVFLHEKFIKESTKSIQPQNKMLLYRGAGLKKSDLNFYNTQIVKNFSYNAVTSTSTKRIKAEGFMKKNDTPEGENIPVMFIIEVPLSAEDRKYQNWLDLKPHSHFPDEDEIALAPGSTFRLINVSEQGNIFEIRLELITNLLTLRSQGQLLHGTFHAQMTKGVTSKLVCLERNELMEALSHLKGNTLIQELELDICFFDDEALQKLSEVLLNIPNLRRLSCISLSSKNDQHLKFITKTVAGLNISELKIRDELLEDQQHVLSFAQGILNLKSLTTLNLNFMFVKIKDEDLNICAKGLRYLTSLTILKINFTQSPEITPRGIEYLCSEGMRYLTKLTTLKLSFDGKGMFEPILEILCTKGIRYLNFLETLNLIFMDPLTVDDNIRDYYAEKSLKPFGNEIKNLKKLVNMRLRLIDHVFTLENFKKFLANNIRLKDVEVNKIDFVPRCIFKREIQNRFIDKNNNLTLLQETARKRINSLELTIMMEDLVSKIIFKEKASDQGKNNLSQRKKYLNSLTNLTLNFEQCKIIDDEGLNYFCSKAFEHLTSLTNLIVRFRRCEIRDGGFRILGSKALKRLTKLDTLSIDFAQSKVTEKELGDLCSDGIKHLSSLRDLKVDFSCNLTNEGLRIFVEKGIGELTSLTNLSLDLRSWEKLAEESLEHLCSKGIGKLTSLTSLCLNFAYYQFSEKGFKIMGQAVQNLTRLTKLRLNFGNQIKNEGLKQFCWHVIKYLTSLMSLSLTFADCPITNDGLEILASQGICRLTKLTNFVLNFKKCAITDDGLKILAAQGIANLTVLTDLTLEFWRCEQITEKGLPHIYLQGIKSLTSLKNLSLKFEECVKISNQGFSLLSSGLIQNLTMLSSLRLCFVDCNIKNEELNYLCSQGINSLKSLTSLSLIFERGGITDEGLKILASKGIRSLTSLTNLSVKIYESKKITNEGLKLLCYHGIKDLKSLRSLELDFENCDISDEGLGYLCSDGIGNLSMLTSLDLNFNKCKITDYGLSILCKNGIQNLTSLVTLSLNFKECDKDSSLTGWGLNFLCFHGVKQLKLLTELKLDFDGITISKKSFKSFHKILDYFGLHLCNGAASTVRSTLPDPIIYSLSI